MDDLVHLTIKWCYLQIQTRSDPLRFGFPDPDPL
jgi:hypothetical protein